MRQGLMILLAGVSACDVDNVQALEVEDAWVFTNVVEPRASMSALHTGTAEVVGGCLEVGGAVVIWRQRQRAAVDSILTAVRADRVVTVTVGGGGHSILEGGSFDDFPEAVVNRCPNVTTVWSASPEPPTLIIE